jgi:DNA-binding transcriptional ArsR family regulator
VIHGEFGISQPAVSQHLKVLRDSGFARVRADGARRVYALEDGALDEAEAWIAQVRSAWTRRLDALATEVARGTRRRATRSP